MIIQVLSLDFVSMSFNVHDFMCYSLAVSNQVRVQVPTPSFAFRETWKNWIVVNPGLSVRFQLLQSNVV